MKRTLLVVSIAVATSSFSVTTHASSFYDMFYSNFTMERSLNMFQGNWWDNGSSSGSSVSYYQEYEYLQQETMMVNLTNYVNTAAPGFGTNPTIGSGGYPTNGCSNNDNPFATSSCDAKISTDPYTGTTVAKYPNGNALYMQNNQVYYEYAYQKYEFSSVDYTMNSFCGCNTQVTGQDLSGTYTTLRQQGYSYESVREMFVSSSYQSGYQSGFMGNNWRNADRGLSLVPVDEATDALLEQAKQAVNL
jgi:hypothetical protein